MAVANTNSSVSYNGDNVSTDFPTTFKFLADADLRVTALTAGITTTLVLGTDYDVDGAGAEEPGGTVTTSDPLAAGTVLTIARKTPIVQPVVLAQSGPLPVKSLTGELDRLTLILQELDRRTTGLESLGNLVKVSTLANGVFVTFDFLTPDPVESFFPAVVPCAGGQNAIGCLMLRAQNLDNAGARFDEPPQAQFQPGNVDNIIILDFVSGLAPATNYRLKLLVLFP